eukprot:3934675-Rhodomonas_salina.1
MSGTPPAPREGHSSVMIGDSMIVFGGMDATGYDGSAASITTFRDVWIADARQGTWTEIVQSDASQ